MKLIKITTVYSAYWQKFYKNFPEFVNQSYIVQKKSLEYDGFGWADFWSHALMLIGYDAAEIIANIKPLQKAWAKEHSVPWTSKWLLEIVFAQVKQFQPTVLFVDDYETFPASWILELRQACPSIKLVFGWCGAPFQDTSVFRAYDVVLSCIPELVNQFRVMGHRSEHLNHAFDPRLLERINIKKSPEIDLSFIGQIARSNQYHLQREQILENLVRHLPIQIFSPNALYTWQDEVKSLMKSSVYEVMRSLKIVGISEDRLTAIPGIGKYAALAQRPLSPINPQLKLLMKAPVFGLEMFQTLQNSKITFNNHINISPRSASNMRLFEATGMGTCLITDWKENLHTLFAPDVEVVTYKSAAECIEKIKWLLANPQKCIEIALAGQKRTLKEHTFQYRAARLHELITMELQR
jgi:spore maturation protein CgeB